ncbi:WecB/TagA/CpsF family glycosyltransferase [Gemmata sp.]|uniref:WecB/TagA/CpsF family glycosyltransferase n=1 Tax=Gemmata sp. TaxID=1914242 RepID=UPI003F6E521C
MSTPGIAARPQPVNVWGLPLAPLTFDQTLDAVEALIAAREAALVVTANLHYAMLTARHPDLARVNRSAALVVADGWPLVLASRRTRTPVPERVAGSDLVPALCGRIAPRGGRVFLLGGAPGVAQEAAAVLAARYPGLSVVGAEAPPFRALSGDETAALLARVRAAAPDLLFVAFGQPKGERWLAEHLPALGPTVSLQIGASLDMLVGRVRRAPRLVQRLGLEWAWRVGTEPRRLAPRYAEDAAFLARRLFARPGRARVAGG